MYKNHKKNKFVINVLVLFILLFVNSSLIASVGLKWDPNPEPDVLGYKIYFGVSSRDYTNSVDVGNVVETRITNLNNNTTYYFAATAYNSVAESDFSNEVSYNMPAISSIPDQTINRNYTSAKIPFTISDSDLTLTYSYSNLSLFDDNSFLFTGTDTNRNLYLTPLTDQIGTSTITLIATDKFDNQATSTFTATVVIPENLVYIVSRLEYGESLTNLQTTNVLLKIFTNPPPGQFYRQYLIITNKY